MLRGGSWNNNRNNARCAYRNNNHPENRNNNIGFRVVVAHDFPYRPELRPGYGWTAEALFGEMARPVPGRTSEPRAGLEPARGSRSRANIEEARPLW